MISLVLYSSGLVSDMSEDKKPTRKKTNISISRSRKERCDIVDSVGTNSDKVDSGEDLHCGQHEELRWRRDIVESPKNVLEKLFELKSLTPIRKRVKSYEDNWYRLEEATSLTKKVISSEANMVLEELQCPKNVNMLTKEHHEKKGATVQRQVEIVETSQRSKDNNYEIKREVLWLKQSRRHQRRFEKYRCRRKKKKTSNQMERTGVRQQLLHVKERKTTEEEFPTKRPWDTEEAVQMNHTAKQGENNRLEKNQKQITLKENQLQWTPTQKKLTEVNLSAQNEIQDLKKENGLLEFSLSKQVKPAQKEMQENDYPVKEKIDRLAETRDCEKRQSIDGRQSTGLTRLTSRMLPTLDSITYTSNESTAKSEACNNVVELTSHTSEDSIVGDVYADIECEIARRRQYREELQSKGLLVRAFQWEQWDIAEAISISDKHGETDKRVVENNNEQLQEEEHTVAVRKVQRMQKPDTYSKVTKKAEYVSSERETTEGQKAGINRVQHKQEFR